MPSAVPVQSRPESGLKVRDKMRAAATRTMGVLCFAPTNSRNRKQTIKAVRVPTRQHEVSVQTVPLCGQVSLSQGTQTAEVTPSAFKGVGTQGAFTGGFDNPLFQHEAGTNVTTGATPVMGAAKIGRLQGWRHTKIKMLLDDRAQPTQGCQEHLAPVARRSKSASGLLLRESSSQHLHDFLRQQELLDHRKQKKYVTKLQASEASLQSQVATLKAQLSSMASHHEKLEIHNTGFGWCLEQFQAKSAALVKERDLMQMRLQAATSPKAMAALRAKIRSEEEARAAAHQVAVRAVAAACAREETRLATVAVQQAAVPVVDAQVATLKAQVGSMRSYIEQLETRDIAFRWSLERFQAKYAALSKDRDTLHTRLRDVTSPEAKAALRAEMRAEEEARAAAHQVAVRAVAAACAHEQARLAALTVQQIAVPAAGKQVALASFGSHASCGNYQVLPSAYSSFYGFFDIVNYGSAAIHLPALCDTPVTSRSQASTPPHQGSLHLSARLLKGACNGIVAHVGTTSDFDIRQMVVRRFSGKVFISIANLSARVVAQAGWSFQLLWLTKVVWDGPCARPLDPRTLCPALWDRPMKVSAEKSFMLIFNPCKMVSKASRSQGSSSESFSEVFCSSTPRTHPFLIQSPTVDDLVHMSMNWLAKQCTQPPPLHISPRPRHERSTTLSTNSSTMGMVLAKRCTDWALVPQSFFSQREQNAAPSFLPNHLDMVLSELCPQLSTVRCPLSPQQECSVTLIVTIPICTVLPPARALHTHRPPALPPARPPLLQILPPPVGHSLMELPSHTLPRPVIKEITSQRQPHGLPLAKSLFITTMRHTGRGHDFDSLLSQLSTTCDSMTASGSAAAPTLQELLQWCCQRGGLEQGTLRFMPKARLIEGAHFNRHIAMVEFTFAVYTDSMLWIKLTSVATSYTAACPVLSNLAPSNLVLSLMSHTVGAQAVDTAQLSVIQPPETGLVDIGIPHTPGRVLAGLQGQNAGSGQILIAPPSSGVLDLSVPYSPQQTSSTTSADPKVVESTPSDEVKVLETLQPEALNTVVSPDNQQEQTITRSVALAAVPNDYASISAAATNMSKAAKGCHWKWRHLVTRILNDDEGESNRTNAMRAQTKQGLGQRGSEDKGESAKIDAMGFQTKQGLVQSSLGLIQSSAADADQGTAAATGSLKHKKGATPSVRSNGGVEQWGGDETAGSSLTQRSAVDAAKSAAAAAIGGLKHRTGATPSVRSNGGVEQWGGDETVGSSLNPGNAADADQGPAAANGQTTYKRGRKPSVHGNGGVPQAEQADAAARATDDRQAAAQGVGNASADQPSGYSKGGGRRTRGGRKAKGGKEKEPDLPFMHQTQRPFSLDLAKVTDYIASFSDKPVRKAMKATEAYQQGAALVKVRRAAAEQQKQAAQQAIDTQVAQQAPSSRKIKGRGGLAEHTSFSVIKAWSEDLPFNDNEGEEKHSSVPAGQQPVGPPPDLQRGSAKKGSSRCTRLEKWGHEGYNQLTKGSGKS